MNDAAAADSVDTMAVRLADVTGDSLEETLRQVRMALALLAVGLGEDPEAVNACTARYGFVLRRR
jgi:hypothetical protein